MLPWKLDHADLLSNIIIAKMRTENTIKIISCEPYLLKKYSDIIEDQEKRGFMKKVDEKIHKTQNVQYRIMP